MSDLRSFINEQNKLGRVERVFETLDPDGQAARLLARREGRIVLLVPLEDPHDVRMMQEGGRAGLAPETTAPVVTGGGGDTKDLDGDEPIGPGPPGPVDRPHAPFPELLDHLEAGKGREFRVRVGGHEGGL